MGMATDTMVNWLPYDSIEVVFNREKLYANLQNHHPACISYNFEDEGEEGVAEKDKPPPKWKKLIDTRANPRDNKAKIVPINEKVSVGPQMPEDTLGKMMKELKAEMKQNLTLYRSKRGQDAMFDDGPELIKQLGEFLKIQDQWLKIDPDCPQVLALFEHGEEFWAKETQKINNVSDKIEQSPEHFIHSLLKPKHCNKHGSPFFQKKPNDYLSEAYAPYQEHHKKEWDSLCEVIKGFIRDSKKFPVQRGKKFKGFPVHFSTPDSEAIRTYLMNDGPTDKHSKNFGLDYRTFINRPEEDIVYTIECRIFPMLGGVVSTWLYIGIQEPWSGDSTATKK